MVMIAVGLVVNMVVLELLLADPILRMVMIAVGLVVNMAVSELLPSAQIDIDMACFTIYSDGYML